MPKLFWSRHPAPLLERAVLWLRLAVRVGFVARSGEALFHPCGSISLSRRRPSVPETGPINSTMGKLLWAIQAWYAEMENEERSEAVQAGQARARAAGKHVGRPKLVFDRACVLKLRNQGRSWSEIAKSAGVSVGSVRRAIQTRDVDSAAC